MTTLPSYVDPQTYSNSKVHKKPTSPGTYVDQVTTSTARKPGSGIVLPDGTRNNKSYKYWKWNGKDWIEIGKKAYESLLAYGGTNNYSQETESTVRSGNIRYPADVTSSSKSSYVLFDFYNYVPPFGSKVGKLANVTTLKNDGETSKLIKKDQNFINENLSAYNQTGIAGNYEPVESQPQLMLYMPDDIQDAYKADWEGKAFGSATAGVLASAGQAGTANKLKSALRTAGGIANRLPVNAAASLITGLAKNITGDQISASDVFAGISGVIKNPNVELLFQKMNLRTFDLSFKLSPYNAGEAEDIKTIVSTFKRAMLPSYSLGDSKVFGFEGDDSPVTGTQSFAIEAGFIKVPQLCQVMFMHGDGRNRYLPKYKMCAITDVGVNYTPDGNYAVFDGGDPVATELKISFMETKLIFAEDVAEEQWKVPMKNPISGGY